MGQEGSFKVSVPIMVDPRDPSSLEIFSFALSAKVIYNQMKTPTCVNLNVELNGWNNAVPASLTRISTKIVVPKEVLVERIGEESAAGGPPETNNNPECHGNFSLLDSKLSHTNALLKALLTVDSKRAGPNTTKRSPESDALHCPTQSPSQADVFKLESVFGPLRTVPGANPQLPVTPPQLPPLISLPGTSGMQPEPPSVQNCGLMLRKRAIDELKNSNAYNSLPSLKNMLSLLERKSKQYSELAGGECHNATTLTCKQCMQIVPFTFQTMVNHLAKHMPGVPLFRCTHCEFASPHSHLIQQHKRVAHSGHAAFEFIDQRHQHDSELAEMAFKCFFDFQKFASLPG